MNRDWEESGRSQNGQRKRYKNNCSRKRDLIATVKFVNDLAAAYFADSIIIMQVDQAACHRAKKLRLPKNIILIFQPAHAPELNPLERVWLHLKQGLRWTLPKNMDELRLLVKNRLAEMTQPVIASLVGRASIVEALSVASLLFFVKKQIKYKTALRAVFYFWILCSSTLGDRYR
ncbi:MAG: transposase [Pseudanabaena sp. CAN_BIN31]|nr:transposase [Pseudanabaena sp. CAN_BIN31]